MSARTVRAVLAGLAAAWLGTSCAVGPDYRPPRTAADAAFSRAPAAVDASGVTVVDDPVDAEWWRSLGDETLDALVERARTANHDVRVAEANLRAARALLGIERRDRWPSATVGGSVERDRSSEALLPPGIDREQTLYEAQLEATWEIDLFGRLRRAVEAASAELEAAEADRRGVAIAVAGEVGRTYVTLVGARRRLEVARTNVRNQEESLELVRALYDAGRATTLDLENARAQLASTRARVPSLETEEARAVHRLAVLCGERPAALDGLLAGAATLPPAPERVAIGDPEALLRRRPDVAAAERRLAAATARIGVATADLFPRISLTGSFGALSTSLDALDDGGSRATSFGPFIEWAAFDLGRVRDRIRVREAETEAALARYERTVLTVLEETENALVRLDRARRRQAELIRADEAASRAAALARERFEAGLDSFLGVLDAEARKLAAQDARAEGAVAVSGAYVDLYVALGGGW